MGAITNDLKALVALDTILIGAKYFYLIPASFSWALNLLRLVL